MENPIEERSNSLYILRFVKLSRILLFGSIIVLQAYLSLPYGIEHYMSSISVPCFIIVLDLIMFNRSKDQFKEFYLVSVIICLIALGTTTTAFLPLLFFPYISNFYLALYYLLGVGVSIVSFIELFTLIYLTRPQEDYNEKPWDDTKDVWESKKDTIDIQ